MTARILVVDDVAANVKLLEARLMAEYFHVLKAENGQDALDICFSGQCDLVILDVLMPGMDGYEVCEKLKQNPDTAHLPVIMVTSLDQSEDRVRGLEAGADDFLTKPVNDLALVTRVKSLVRLKMLTDDLRLRAANGDELALDNFRFEADNRKRTRLVMVDDNPGSYEPLLRRLSDSHDITLVTDPNDALFRVVDGGFDAALVSMKLKDTDSLRLCSHLRSLERTRTLPIIVLAGDHQEDQISRAIEIGVNDYIHFPLDPHELSARLRTQLKRKRYHDCLRNSVQKTVEMAVRDPLTDLHNRRYFDSHFSNMFEKSLLSGKPLAALICDIDHFKGVNDTYGHDVGDMVIIDVAARIRKSIRNVDMACRYGGEEFVVVMPGTDTKLAERVAERIRSEVEAHPVVTKKGAVQVPVTVSVGVSAREGNEDTSERLLKRADIALYTAKKQGRNQVICEAA